MIPIRHSSWTSRAAVALVLGLAACSSPVDPVERHLETLRDATRAYTSFDAAQAANYTLLFADMCMAHATDGGMGYHYVNTELLDAELSITEPEALIYESRNGQMNLVAVEYVVPFAIRGSDQPPPELYGESFRKNETYELWTLHVWAWKDNPSGVFADYNPAVSCP